MALGNRKAYGDKNWEGGIEFESSHSCRAVITPLRTWHNDAALSRQPNGKPLECSYWRAHAVSYILNTYCVLEMTSKLSLRSFLPLLPSAAPRNLRAARQTRHDACIILYYATMASDTVSSVEDIFLKMFHFSYRRHRVPTVNRSDSTTWVRGSLSLP